MLTQAGLWAATLVLGAAPLYAADRSPSMSDPAQTQMEKHKLEVADTDIKSLRERGYTWGDIGRALVIADQSGKKLSDVTSLRDSGLGWDDIGSRFNVSGIGSKSGKKSKKTHPPTESGMREAPAGKPGTEVPLEPVPSPDVRPEGTSPNESGPNPSPMEPMNPQPGSTPPSP